jgi:sterol desaturase/sphingolipid hydroxylase (fatty acid hydroxylase superfamily)
VAVFAFLALTTLAVLNHTRHDVWVRLGRVSLYATAFHDLHHNQITWNYGQYTMVWDMALGSFKSPFPVKSL